jgi:ribose transport system ATP-binding protein
MTRQEQQNAQSYIDSLAIKTPSSQQLCLNLSGGNQQKVVLAKWLATNPSILMLDEPTRGIDINAKNEIYELIKKLSQEGKSFIVVSSEIPELLALADRFLVMSGGRITAELSAEEANEDKLLKAAIL